MSQYPKPLPLSTWEWMATYWPDLQKLRSEEAAILEKPFSPENKALLETVQRRIDRLLRIAHRKH